MEAGGESGHGPPSLQAFAASDSRAGRRSVDWAAIRHSSTANGCPMRLNRSTAVAAAALAACISTPGVGSAQATPPSAAADMVLVNGRIFVADSAGTVVRAMAVRDGKVVAAGSDAEARALAGPGTRIVDL